MSTVHFRGSIVAEGPLTVSLPGVRGIPRMGGRAYFPAGSLNGMIRHAAHRAVIHARRARGMPPLSLDASYFLAVGVDTGRALSSVSSVSDRLGAMLEVRQKNPLVSLFGRWGMAGRLSVGNAFAPSDDVVVLHGSGARRHPVIADPRLVEFVAVDEIDRLEKILAADSQTSQDVGPLKDEEKKLRKQLRATVVADERNAINARLAEIDAAIRAIKDEREGASESIQRPLEPYEVIPAGTRLEHKMALHGASDVELGALLWTLQHLASESFVGGHRRSGCGEISAQWEVTRYDFGAPQPTRIGAVGFGHAGYACEGDVLDAARLAWDTVLDDALTAIESVA